MRTPEQVRSLLASYIWHCAPDCPGWIVNVTDPLRPHVERCDECANCNELLRDDECAQLPEAVAKCEYDRLEALTAGPEEAPDTLR